MLTPQRYKELYELYHHQLVCFCKDYVGWDDAQDIVQDVFIYIHKSQPEERGIKTLLFKVAKHKCLDFIKSRKSKIKQKNFIKSLSDDYSDNHADNALIKSELIKIIHDFINSLAPKEKIVFEMLYFDILDVEEVSKILGRSINTIRVQKMNINKKLNKIGVSLEKYFWCKTQYYRLSRGKEYLFTQYRLLSQARDRERRKKELIQA